MVFGSYGWSGEGVPNVCARLTSLKCALAAEGLKVNFVPTAEDLDKAFALGEALGKAHRLTIGIASTAWKGVLPFQAVFVP